MTIHEISCDRPNPGIIGQKYFEIFNLYTCINTMSFEIKTCQLNYLKFKTEE